MGENEEGDLFEKGVDRTTLIQCRRNLYCKSTQGAKKGRNKEA